MRESTKMFLHYLTGAVILITGAIHLLANNVPSFAVVFRLSELYPVNLGIFLAALLYHALNGLRVILIELIPGPCAGKAISWIMVLIGVAAYIYGLQVLLQLFAGW